MLRVGNSSVVKIYIIRPKPGPVAKNATPRSSGWESNPRPRSALPFQIRSFRFRFESETRGAICVENRKLSTGSPVDTIQLSIISMSIKVSFQQTYF